jgi:hypothetical protein
VTATKDFLSGKPFVVTEDELKLPWAGRGRVAFSCGFCPKQFELGDTVRWVYVEGAPNTFVCTEHDGPDVAERFREHWRTVIRPILDRWA